MSAQRSDSGGVETPCTPLVYTSPVLSHCSNLKVEKYNIIVNYVNNLCGSREYQILQT